MRTQTRLDRSPWRHLLPSRPFVFILLAFIAGLLFFAAFRLLFVLDLSDRIGNATTGDILTAFGVGVRFDQIIILSILAPLLAALPWLPLKLKVVRAVILAYLGTLFGVCFLALLGDIPFYKVFESRLNYQAVDYLSGGKTTWRLIVSDPRFWQSILIFLVATAAFVFLVRWLLNRTGRIPHRRSWTGQLVYLLVFAALFTLGIRGRTALSPIKWGAAYISHNPFINQLGLNGPYTLARALTEEGGDPRLSYLDESDRFPFVPFAHALDSVQHLLYQPGDTWLEPDSSLLRDRRQPANPWGFDPNVIIVMMESFSGRTVSSLGAARNLTPNFDRLAGEGILFTNFYATGNRTNRGLPGALCAWPSIPGRSVMTRYNARHPFVALSEILHTRGYFNSFAYGGDLVFDNMEGFFRTKGFDRFYDENHFGRENIFAKWGIPDDVVFAKVAAMTDSLPRPLQMTVLTLSNHEPFDLPDSSVQRYFNDADSSRLFNAILYADYALGHFINEMKRLPVFDSTIFVFTADHAHYAGATLTIHPRNFHIPLLIYSPALLGADSVRIDRLGSQVDITPTLMGLLGGDYRHASWGRNLLDTTLTDPGYAVINVFNRVGLIEPDIYYMEHIGQPGRLLDMRVIEDTIVDLSASRPDDLDRIRRRLHLYLQAAEQLSTPGAIP